jgi:hypothetical protein
LLISTTSQEDHREKEFFPYRAGIFAGFDPLYLIGFYHDEAHRTLLFISLRTFALNSLFLSTG